MTRLIAFILILLPTCLKGSEDLFNDGCQAYAVGNYHTAYDLFESIKDKTSDVWYNMGNAAYKQDKLIQALVCWERAAKDASGPLRTACNYNLEQVRDKLSVPKNTSSFFVQLVRSLTTGSWQLIFLLVWYTAIFSMLYANKKRLQALLLLVSCLFGSILFAVTQQKNRSRAVVIKDDTSLFAGPDEQYHAVQKLPPVAYLTVEGTKDSWYKVRYNQTVGWIPMEAVEVI